MSETRKEALLSLVNGNSDILEDIHDAIRQFGLTEKAYARIFCLLHFDCVPASERLTFSPADKEWMRNKRTLSDIKLFSVLSGVCDVVREYVIYSWESCVFSSWLPNRELQKAEKEMDNMESLVKMKSVVRMAADFMRADDQTGKVRWENIETPDADDAGEEQ